MLKNRKEKNFFLLLFKSSWYKSTNQLTQHCLGKELFLFPQRIFLTIPHPSPLSLAPSLSLSHPYQTYLTRLSLQLSSPLPMGKPEIMTESLMAFCLLRTEFQVPSIGNYALIGLALHLSTHRCHPTSFQQALDGNHQFINI